MSELFLDTRSTPERRIFDLRALGFRTMLVCGRYEYSTAQPPLASQAHPGWLVIAFLEKGFQLYEINGEPVELRGGQLMRVFPGESYGTGKFPEHRGILYWLIVRTDPAVAAEGAWGMDGEAASALLARLVNRATARVESASAMVGEIFNHIFESALPETALDVAVLRHRLVSVLLETGLREEVNAPVARLAGEIARRLALEPGSMPRAEEMAGYVGLSVSAFYERFGRETGMTPKEFAVRWKVNEALKRLRAGQRVTDVAFDLGFSSSQYFASVVKRHSGQPPGYWKRTQPGEA